MKKIYTFFLTLVMILMCSNVVMATSDDINFEDIIAPLSTVTQILLIVAAGVCVCKIIHIGILFVTSSAADKSNAKMALLPWLVGTFVCFGAAIIGPAIIGIFATSKDVLEY